nr:MAG TPA: peptidase [Bacteriophage sp.]
MVYGYIYRKIVSNMKKIKYFKLSEFINSATAKRQQIDNTPSFEIVDNLNRLADYLDTIREKYGKPIFISSGFRCPLLNQAVGGVVNSQHLKGLAADLVCADMEKLLSIIRETKGFDQLITEHKKGCKSYWIHISVAPVFGKPRNQVIINLEKK